MGNYNIFQDPTLQELGAADRLTQVLRGEIVHLPDLNAPYMDITRPFDVYDSDIRTIRADITCFPLLSDEGAVECFAAVFIVKEIRRGSEGVALGKQYMETHWQEPFDAGETARAACLSKGHFARMFKKHTGITPHEYHSNYRIGKLKEKLLDHNLSIAEAFAACNIRYNGHAAGVFREKVGVAPSEFRRAARQNDSSRSNRTKNDIFATNCAHI